MNTLDKQYLGLCKTILSEGIRKPNRTGTDTFATTGLSIRHDMSEGFPLITTKRIAKKTMLAELEGFIKGITSKKWFQERGCNIWNEWCNPEKVRDDKTDEARQRMLEEDDLGLIYGAQWRDFHDPNSIQYELGSGDVDYGNHVDQLRKVVDKLHTDPSDRRMIVSAWNPNALDRMALPPCHFAWQAIVVGDRLDLVWSQRSVDVGLGLCFNIGSYGALLHLLAKEGGFKEGILTGNFGDVHIYENHIDAIDEQMSRESYDLPKIVTENFTSIFDWEHTDTNFVGYKHHPAIKMDVAV